MNTDQEYLSNEPIFNSAFHLLEKYKSTIKFLSLRLPSLLLADLLLLNSDQITEYVKERYSFLNYILIYLISKIVLAVLLFIIALLFTLSSNYVIRIYKIFVLVSLPFLYTTLIDYININTIEIFNLNIPKFLLICLVYSFLITLTISIYTDIYSNFLIDNQQLSQYYHFYESKGEEERFLDLLSQQSNEKIEDLIRRDHLIRNQEDELNLFLQDMTYFDDDTIQKSIKKRQVYIQFYSVLSLLINETSILNLKSTEERFNIISLGYLILLQYDLYVNSEQIILRLMLRLKILIRIINHLGLNNFISFNWFERIRVPFLLRVYFYIKVLIFTLNFFAYLTYYINLDYIITNKTTNESSSLFSSLYSIVISFKKLNKINELNSINTNTHEINLNKNQFIFESIYSQFTSLIPFIKINLPDFEINVENLNFSLLNIIFVYFKMLVLNLTSTLVSISCTTSVISYKFHLIGTFVNNLLHTDENKRINSRANNRVNNQEEQEPEADIQNVGDVAAILFFLLSVQSGLSSLDAKQRIEKFFRNYSLLFIAILHYFHTSLDSQLMTLSASSKLTIANKRHFRILSICFSLIIIPITIIIILLRYFEISTWLLAATAFNVELIVKMIVSFLLYSLFLKDSKQVASEYNKIINKKKNDDNEDVNETADLNDKLDDYIYYVKAFGHVFEFMIALFLFFNGAYILFFESYGAIRAIMMCIHAYFHIYCQARKGWSVFIKRRTAIVKLKNLVKFDKKSYINMIKTNKPNLDENELLNEYEEKTSDVCPICFCEIGTHNALITQCNHIFHFKCLRKWLYLQDTCPMCHQLVYQNLNNER